MIEYDTGGACEKLLKNKYKDNTAVIAGPECKKIFPLEVIEERVQNNQNNYTRFLVLEKKSKKHDLLIAPKFSLSFEANHDPGALLKILNIFQEKNINLTKIESMPIPDSPFSYTFFVDGEWPTLNQENETIGQLLQKKNINFKVIGVYQIHQRKDW